MAGFHTELAPANKAPQKGVVTTPRVSDHRTYMAGDLTPERVESILNSTICGSPREQNDAFDRMLERDGHIACEYDKRLMAIGGLDWDIKSASQVREGDLSDEDASLADEIAAYVRAVMSRISVVGHGIEGTERIGAGLAHLDDAIGRGVMGLEQEWDTASIRIPGSKKREARTVEARVPIRWHLLAPGRWLKDPDEPWRLRVLRDDSDFKGLAIDEQAEGKFIVHAPRSIGGSGFRGALHIPAWLMFFGKSYGWRWLLVAVEIFGKPTRIAKLPANAPKSEWDAALEMLIAMGDCGGGVFSAETSIEVISSQFTGGGTQSLYERLLKICDGNISKNYVGNALLTEMQDSEGAKNQPTQAPNEVRKDIRNKDIVRKNSTLTEQAVRQIVRASQYGNTDESLWPEYETCIPKPQDDVRDLDLMERGARMGKKFTAGQISERFGWALAGDEKDDTVLEAPAAGFDPLGAMPTAHSDRRPLNLVAHRALETILKPKTSPLSAIGPWILTAVLASQAHSSQVAEELGRTLERFDAVAHLQDGAPPAEITLALASSLLKLPTVEMAELARQSVLASRLHGMRFAQLKIEAARKPQAHKSWPRGDCMDYELVAHADRISFERLPFVEAIESLRDRIGMTPDDFIKLDAEARSRAWRVAAVADMDLLAVLHTRLVSTMNEGATVRDFRLKVLPQMLDRAGWTGENPWHADVVFYQNFAMAHAAGRFRQYDEAGIQYWRFVGYEGACEICQPHIGKVFRIGDVDRVPPLHFWCNCIDEVVFAHELARGELVRSSSVQAPALVEERMRISGYKWNVRQYAALEPLNVDKYEPQYRDAYRKLAAERKWSIAA